MERGAESVKKRLRADKIYNFTALSGFYEYITHASTVLYVNIFSLKNCKKMLMAYFTLVY